MRMRVTDRVRVRVRAICLAHPAPRRRAEVRMPVEQRVVVTCVHGYTVAVSGPMGQVGPRHSMHTWHLCLFVCGIVPCSSFKVELFRHASVSMTWLIIASSAR